MIRTRQVMEQHVEYNLVCVCVCVCVCVYITDTNIFTSKKSREG